MKEEEEESILDGQEPIWKEEALPDGWEAYVLAQGDHWQKLDHGIRLLVGPGGSCRTPKGVLEEIWKRV